MSGNERQTPTDRLRVVDRVKDEHVNLYQLVVTAIFRKIGPTQKVVAQGYSKFTHARYTTPPRYGSDHYYQKQVEALMHAEAQVLSRHPGTWGQWVVEEIIDEFWLRH